LFNNSGIVSGIVQR